MNEDFYDLSRILTPDRDGPPVPYLRTAVVVSTGASWTINLDGVDTPATALNGVTAVAGDAVQVLTKLGSPPLVIGTVTTTDWQMITLASANWTIGRTPEWRLNGGRIELRGTATRTTSSFPPASNLFVLGSAGNPPVPSQSYNIGAQATIVAATPDSQFMTWIVDVGVPSLRSGATTHTVAVGDTISFDGLWWPS